MNEKQFQDIKDKIKSAEQKKDRAEGALERLKKSWKDEFGFTTIEEVEEKIAELETTIADDEKKLKKNEDKLESMVDWDSI
jgi:hypothetical protein